ncbi:bile acid:sodium symporter family protein [Alkalihalobacillus trypoxylicola]|uniref:Bile acid:sodium symporter n=1 Tax=Alkalihalobacillus trypoxylicola TaxID=519424 RepID=A0A162CXA2_9BACI|nr:bile acid:sodium symporter family protein [Alkalihalobacillus trypoxylicola]KYG27009.1 hypothetical protein AZF04_11785 [Alkalihalobacillus trypoxylicola]
MLVRLNKWLEKFLPIITPICVMIGVFLSERVEFLVFLVPYIFAVITLTSSLGIHPKELYHVFRHPLALFLSLFILQVCMPFLAFLVGTALFGEEMATVTGLVLAFAIPTGVISLMWVTIYGGNRSLSLAIILVNTLLSPIIVPLTLSIFIGFAVEMDTFGLIWGLLNMVVFPSLLGMMINYFRKGKVEPLVKPLAPFSKFGIMFVIIINSSVAAPYLKQFNLNLLLILLSVLSLALFAYVLGFFIGKITKIGEAETISIMYNSGMRNIGVGAALAVLYFPPQTTLPVIIGTLFQQIIAACCGKLIERRAKKNK